MIIDKGETLGFYDALYKAQCKTCKCELEWDANFDADGTTYYADCCGLDYYMKPESVVVSVEDREKDEDE